MPPQDFTTDPTPLLLFVLSSPEGCYATVGSSTQMAPLLESLLRRDLGPRTLEQHREDYLDYSLWPQEAAAHQTSLRFLFYVMGQEESADVLASWDHTTPFQVATELDYSLTVSRLPLDGVLDVYAGAFHQASAAPEEELPPKTGASLHLLEHSSQVLANVHAEGTCRDLHRCPIHALTDHPLRAFPQVFRHDRGFMERQCPHGVGHPDPDDAFADPVHGCDGCCQRP